MSSEELQIKSTKFSSLEWYYYTALTLITPHHATGIFSIPPENIRKLLVFCF